MNAALTLLACLLYCQLACCQSISAAKAANLYTGGGSVILTIVDKDSIVLMADSKQSFDNNQLPVVVNKINTYQNTFYAQAGTSVLMKNGEKILDLNDTLGSIIKNNKFKLIARVYKKVLKGIIKTYVDRYHMQLHSFTNHDDKDSFVCKISIVKYDKKTPQYIFGSFLLFEKHGGFNIRFVKDYRPPGFPFINKSGNLIPMQNFLAKNPAYFNNAEGLIDKCIYLIKLTAWELPNEVGCPIKIIIIKPSGHTWLAPIEDCSF